ncbi:MAG TPA: putative collagen-binding domain-containing protein, partial [Polyangiales bacterium]|nr:putative collagen-binding domain-containing protein [Polyangiales bacterium]
QYWFQLFARLPWHELTPDADHTAITAGYGELGTTNYVSAARTPDYRFVMAYLSQGGSVKIDLDRMPGTKVRVTWFDPTNGRTREGNQLSGGGQRSVQAPSAKSWLLVARSL